MTRPTLKEKMEDIVGRLNDAAKAYYSGTDESLLSDTAYDKLMTELVKLEVVCGEVLPNSPTNRVGFAESDGQKMRHKRPILSLKDTKSIDELLHFIGERQGVLSWKLDGLSIVLYYRNGRLTNALSRGDGIIGKVIFKNVKLIKGVPLTIPYRDTLVVRGEGCISLSEFDQIKKTQQGERFTNARNLAAGIINAKNANAVLLRHMTFTAHSVVYSEGKLSKLTSRSEVFKELARLGFNVVPHSKVLNFLLIREIERYTNDISNFPYPVDGLVLSIDDIPYGESLGTTAKFPKHSMAFKWPDETAITRVTGMKWSVSQTGLITPVVIFEPVSLEGTTVRQANLHSLKLFEELGIGVGDKIKVYKANKIIPEIEENFTRSKTETYPKVCPICGNKTTVETTERTRKLYCTSCGQINSIK